MPGCMPGSSYGAVSWLPSGVLIHIGGALPVVILPEPQQLAYPT